jgi:hypothetical protein
MIVVIMKCFGVKSLSSQQPLWVSLVVSLSCFGCHYLFYYAQFVSNLWRIDLHAVLTDVSIQGELLDGAIPVNISVPNTTISETVKEYGFNESIVRLREDGAETMAWVLFVCSGLWPHIKLFSVHILWYVPNHPKWRTFSLKVFEFFGRWSAMDVFVMLYLILILNIGISDSTNQLLQNVVSEFPALLDGMNGTAFSHTACHGAVHYHKIHSSKFKECVNIFDLFLFNPEVRHDLFKQIGALNSTGYINAAATAVSDSGLYCFSCGVWFSLIISSGIHVVDESLHNSAVFEYSFDAQLRRPLACNPRVGKWRALLAAVFCVGCAVVLYMASFDNLMMTNSRGGVTNILKALTNNTDYLTNYWSTGGTVSLLDSSAGSGPFLAKDMLIFVMIGPAVVFLATLVLLALPLRRKEQFSVVAFMQMASSFSAIEVMIIMQFILAVEVPVLTETMLEGIFAHKNHGLYFCDLMENSYNRELPCFEINVHRIMPLWICMVGAFLSVHVARLWTERIFADSIAADGDNLSVQLLDPLFSQSENEAQISAT